MNLEETQPTLEDHVQVPVSRGRQQLVLTVLSHYDVSWVGAWVVVASRMELARNRPEFELMTGERKVLNDPFLSRKPLVLEPLREGAVQLDSSATTTRIQVDGERMGDASGLDQKMVLSAEALARGVVLELSDRVALVLHTRMVRAKPAVSGLGLIGASDAMVRIRSTLQKVAPNDVCVLIRGESGVGKELVARALHEASRRHQRAFETLNMATVSQSLAASELFGHMRGAFTGAHKEHVGAFGRADKGTLFLDEIGDTPLEVQPMLLRALESGEIRPVGASRNRRVDVRVVAATDVNLEQAIAAGEFRSSLLHRLSGFCLDVPPLRARRDDIGLLAVHFLREELERIGAAHCLVPDAHRGWFYAPVIAKLARYDWPGNVRQLRNSIRQLAILSCDEPRLGDGVDLEGLLPKTPTAQGDDAAPSPGPAEPARRIPSGVGEDELIAALREHRWRLAPAAAALGISRTSIYTLIERSQRIRKAADIGPEELLSALKTHNQNVELAADALEVSAHALKIRMRALKIQA